MSLVSQYDRLKNPHYSSAPDDATRVYTLGLQSIPCLLQQLLNLQLKKSLTCKDGIDCIMTYHSYLIAVRRSATSRTIEG